VKRTLSSLCKFALALCATALAAHAAAQDFPSKPIKLIIPYPPGGLTDIVTRAVVDEAGRALGQTIVLENRSGAGGQIGLQAMMSAPRDGHTIALVVPATMITLPLTNKEFPFKPLQDFEPLTTAVETFLTLVVGPNLGVRNLQEFIAYGKKNPGKMNYGTPGVGTSFHFNNVQMGEKLGIDGTHVPYNGEVKILTDLGGGELQYALVSNAGKPFIDGGKVLALAVTSSKRVVSQPNVATFREQGVDFVSDGWVGYAAPAGVPVAVLDKLNGALVKALETPKVKAALTEMGYTVVANSRRDFRANIERSTKWYADTIRAGRIKLN